MPNKQNDDDDARRPDRNIEHIREITKTIRYVVVALVVLFCVWKICNTVLKIVEKPSWWELLLPLLTAILTPAGVLAFVLSKYRGGAKKRNDLLKSAQSSIDPSRTSSGLRPDGTNPTEDEA